MTPIYDEIKSMLEAGFPLIYLATTEYGRVMQKVRSMSFQLGYKCHTWDAVDGLKTHVADNSCRLKEIKDHPATGETLDPLALLEYLRGGLCMQEDTKIYGEPYYHVEHQIPLSSVCVRHKCRLKQIAVDNPRLALNNKFYPLGTMGTDREPDMDVTPAELQVSELVRGYWRLPAFISPPACNNLYQTLLNSGYRTIVRQNGLNIDRAKLYTALCDYHGAETVAKRFGASITTSMMNRIKTWEQLLPDRYILIQAMLGVDTKTVFDPEPVPDTLREKMEHMAVQGGFCTLRQVARTLGLKQYEVNAILRHYGMAPFWRAEIPGKSQTARRGLLRCTVDEAELERIRQYSQELGYRCEGAFALDCVRYVMEQAGRK